MKRILIVSRSFFPVNSPRSFRTTELVKEFAKKQGHEVTLLTLKDDEHHIPFEKEFGVTIKDLGPLRFPEINLNGKGGVTRLVKRVARRGLVQLLEYPDIELVLRTKRMLEKESGHDLLISIAVPHPIHWGVAWAWQDNNSIAQTWVADCGDPYMGATLDSFDKMFYFKYVEKAFCRKADYISVPIEDARKGYYPEFRDKIKVIPQGFNFDGVKLDCSAYTRHTVPTFAYAGAFIPGGRDPREFLDYLVSIDQPYKFIVYTKSTGLVEPYIERANGKIELRDYIPRRELLKMLSGMDFLVNFENSTSRQLPSKLIDYYLTGRPVLSLGSTDINKKAIDEFLSGDYSKQYDFQNMDQYRIENVCRRFLDLCKERGPNGKC
ncbi:hypothetical protein NC796_03775 [Aliifodinibius sp. S!AR15-10]|uniref:hypothetical protein n=1 Tax=Aliifodinibius sp. S!AR15-10 TaxID=2950437 RepID=UPI002857524E|nr:hypothetical protein [Aliifodinibius sp. S!AR15-10]MDR8390245.1 hypothetical protein [Aliifodinibius sp. S!AR15-10]